MVIPPPVFVVLFRLSCFYGYRLSPCRGSAWGVNSRSSHILSEPTASHAYVKYYLIFFIYVVAFECPIPQCLAPKKGKRKKKKNCWRIKHAICLNSLEISSDQGEGDCNSGHECNSGGLFQGLYLCGQNQHSSVRTQVPDICWTMFILTTLAPVCKLLQGHMHSYLPRG